MNRTAQFVLLVGFMILYVVMGTLLHESGHILIARLLGYRTRLHFASMDWYLPDGAEGTNQTDGLYITLGGVLTVDLIGILFLCILVFRKENLSKPLFWTAIFFSMLIYRHILLSLTGFGISLTQGKPMSYGRDEREIAEYFHLSPHMIGIPLLLIGIISACVLFFVVLDKPTRARLMLATAIGGVLGYIGWISYLGPILMP